MRIAIFGSGGVGGYFGGRLAQAGHEVIFIARGANLRALRSAGLKIHSFLGDFQVHPVQAFEDPAEAGSVEAVLVAVKAWQVTEAAQAMHPLLGRPGSGIETVVAPFQNGVEAPGQLAAALGPEVVLGGFCRISASLVMPGVIEHRAIYPEVALGELNGDPTRRVERLAHAFRQAGIQVDLPDDINSAMWEKFLFIAALGGVGAVTRAPVGVVRSHPQTRALLQTALREMAAVAQASGISLPADAVTRTLTYIDNIHPGIIPSMQRDLMEGKPSELESQTGAVLRLAHASGVPAPLHETLYASLLPQELRARGQLEW